MFWVSVRKVVNGSFGDDPEDIGKTRYLDAPAGQIPAPSHDVGRKMWLARLLATFPKDAAGVRRGDLVVFVHGYNNAIAHVAGRHELIGTGLSRAGFPCVVVSFDWPSGDSALGYLDDRHDAKITAMRLVDDVIRLMIAARTDDCAINIHVLAHSMGAYIVREAFDDADDSTAANANWTISQLAFVAADLSSASLAADNSASESLYRHCHRLTNSFSGYDAPLQVSELKRVGLSPRAGRVGLPIDAPAKACDVDCSKRYLAFSASGQSATVIGDKTHSWYFHDQVWMNDLAATLRGDVDRNLIAGRTSAPGGPNDFVLAG
jgi:pimeloyl-ACP methyl ester carboxylesterase